MAGKVSPGIFTNELAFNDYAQVLGTTRPAIVGGATKGPVNTPTIVTSEPDLISKFGQPQANDYGLLSAVQFLKAGQQLVYLRASNGEDTTDSTVQGATGATGGTAASGTLIFTGAVNAENGDTVTIPDAAIRASGSITITGVMVALDEIVIDDGVNPAVTFRFAASQGDVVQTNTLREVVIGASTVASALALQQAIENSPVFDITATVAGNILSLINDTAGVAGNVVMTETDSNNVLDLVGMAGGAASSNVVTYEFDASVAATGSVTMTAAPADGDTIVIDDGVNPAVTYNFQTGATITETDQLREVIKGADQTSAALALANKINSDTPLIDITASPAAGVCSLVNDTAGSAGNVAISENEVGAVITVVGMSGGINAGTVGASNIAVSIGATALLTNANLVSAIEAQRLAGNSSITAEVDDGGGDPQVNVTSTTAHGILGNNTITQVGGGVTVAGFTGGVDQTAGTPADSLTFEAASPGSWGDALQFTITAPSTASDALSDSFDIQISAPVDNDGTVQVVENFLNLVNDSASPRYVTKALAEGIRGDFAASGYLRALVIATHAPSSGTYTLGVSGLNVSAWTPGADGITGLVYSDYVGTLSSTGTTTGLQALRDPELTEFNVLLVPGNSDSRVVDAMLTTADERGDCVAVLDVPFGLTRDQAVDWHNGVATAVANSPTAPLDNGHATAQWPWFEIFSEHLDQNVWMPPSVGALEVYARTDSQVGPWRAPAGFQRGSVDGLRLEFNSRRVDRDALNGGGNRINPIADFQSQGLILYGNRTLQRANGPLDSVHVLRMLLFAKKSIVTAIQYLQFEPNDPQTWRNFVQTVEPILTAIAAERGITSFSVKCDSETNPDALIAQKTMRGVIFIRPTLAAEIIEIDFALQSTGEGDFSI